MDAPNSAVIDEGVALTDQQMWDEATAEDSTSPDAAASEQQPATPADAAAAAPAAPDAPAPAETTPAAVDPYAGLHPDIVAQLKLIPSLAHQLSSANGRIAAMQRAQAPTPAPAPAAPRFEKVEAIRKELPEVAEALDEIAARAPAQALDVEAVKGELTAKVQEEVLDSLHPDWPQKVVSDDFQAWLATQPAEYQHKVKTTNRAADMLAALNSFDKRPAPSAPPTGKSRVDNAAVLQSGVRRRQPLSVDDMDEQQYWDHITKDS